MVEFQHNRHDDNHNHTSKVTAEEADEAEGLALYT